MSPWDSLTGKKRDYLARMNNVLQTNVLQEIIDAKAKGATFGALSNEELRMLQTMSSAAMGSARVKDGKTIGYDITADEMERQLRLLRDGYLSNITRITGNNPNELEQTQGAQATSQT